MSTQDELANLESRIEFLENRVGQMRYELDKRRLSLTEDGRVVVNANHVDALGVVYKKAHAVVRSWKNGSSISQLFDKLHELSESLEEVV